jgi:hypothetical protein
VSCDQFLGGRSGLARKDCKGHRLEHLQFSWFAIFGIAIAVGLWTLPASAAPSDGSHRTQALDELLHRDATSGQLEGWHPNTAASYNGQQIVNDARLARQLAAQDSITDEDALSGPSLATKKHHRLHPIVVGLLAVGAILVLSTVVLLIWSRIVQYREMRDAPSPMAFNYPRV